jgi:hypothetical protein
MSNREVMQQALEFLESGNFVYPTQLAIDLLKALEQSVQQPVAWMRPSEEGYESAFRDHHTIVSCAGNPWKGWLPLYTTPPLPVQEPVATTAAAHVKNEYGYCKFHTAVPNDTKLYTTPPQRQWVGLTDEEILRADPWMGTSDSDINPYQILLKVRILEAKLKERNT